jgi:hypothetical protein
MALNKRIVEPPVENPNYPTETSSGLPTGTVKYYREPRKVARVFTAMDVARLAKQVSKHTSPIVIAAYVLAVLGIGTGLCKTVGALNRILGLWSFIEDASSILATAAVIEVLLNSLGRVKIPIVKRLAIALIVLLALLQKVVGFMVNLVGDVVIVRGLATEIGLICDAIKNAPDKVVKMIDL